MLERIRNSAAAMTAIVRRQEITANNLANVNTAGFRKDRLFEELLQDSIDADGVPTSRRELTTFVDRTHGNFEFTERPLDVALGDEGFFVVEDVGSGKSFYTRSGRFNVDADGLLVDASGRTVMGQSGPITIPTEADEVAIFPSGDVKSGQQVLGKLMIVDFAPDVRLERIGGATFDALGAETIDIDAPDIKAGYFEQSNVNALTEMTDMMQQSRLFESQQRAMRTLDQTIERAIRDLGQY